ncbi:MAG: hypothetical protein GY750_18280 [Lentisphaerae bacterium]|nr:hypothetical protein [Lentisphaerota bacterium]MCP4103345.1 hypothetical protein [Lentisphaerota bacterium]
MRTQLIKMLLLGSCIIAIGATPLVASESTSSDTGKERAERGKKDRKKRLEHLKKDLNLNDAQAKKLEKLLREQHEQRKAFKKKLSSILSENQMRKLREIMEKHRHERRDGDDGRRRPPRDSDLD